MAAGEVSCGTDTVLLMAQEGAYWRLYQAQARHVDAEQEPPAQPSNPLVRQA